MQALHQHFFDEILRRQCGEASVEMFDDHAVDTGGRQRFQLVAQIGNALWHQLDIGFCRAGAFKLGEKFARMRFEGHHGGVELQSRGGCAHLREQRLVAAMYAVEIADRQCAGRTRCGVGKSSKYLHRFSRKPLPKLAIIKAFARD